MVQSVSGFPVSCEDGHFGYGIVESPALPGLTSICSHQDWWEKKVLSTSNKRKVALGLSSQQVKVVKIHFKDTHKS